MEGDIARERRLRGGDRGKKAQIKILKYINKEVSILNDDIYDK